MGKRNLPEYAENLRNLMDAHRLSQAHVARRSRLARGVISRYCAGIYAPSSKNAAMVARAFGVLPSDISTNYAHLDASFSSVPDLTPDLPPDPSLDSDDDFGGAGIVSPKWSITPSSSVPGMIHLNASLDLPANIAAQIINLLAQGGAR